MLCVVTQDPDNARVEGAGEKHHRLLSCDMQHAPWRNKLRLCFMWSFVNWQKGAPLCNQQYEHDRLRAWTGRYGNTSSRPAWNPEEWSMGENLLRKAFANNNNNNSKNTSLLKISGQAILLALLRNISVSCAMNRVDQVPTIISLLPFSMKAKIKPFWVDRAD